MNSPGGINENLIPTSFLVVTSVPKYSAQADCEDVASVDENGALNKEGATFGFFLTVAGLGLEYWPKLHRIKPIASAPTNTYVQPAVQRQGRGIRDHEVLCRVAVRVDSGEPVAKVDW